MVLVLESIMDHSKSIPDHKPSVHFPMPLNASSRGTVLVLVLDGWVRYSKGRRPKLTFLYCRNRWKVLGLFDNLDPDSMPGDNASSTHGHDIV